MEDAPDDACCAAAGFDAAGFAAVGFAAVGLAAAGFAAGFAAVLVGAGLVAAGFFVACCAATGSAAAPSDRARTSGRAETARSRGIMSGGMEVDARTSVRGNTPETLRWRAQTCHVRARFTTLVYGALLGRRRAAEMAGSAHRPTRPRRKPPAPRRCLLINPYIHPASEASCFAVSPSPGSVPLPCWR